MNKELMGIAERGYCVIRNVLDTDMISMMRQAIIKNLEVMSNTRPTMTSRHIAGFHRFPRLESIHMAISNSNQLELLLAEIYRGREVISLGLSDITINRSQPWHTDLLRGAYAKYLTSEICWDPTAYPCLKALVYLQDGSSLQVVAGSHRLPIDLSDDQNAIPTHGAEIERVNVSAGDVVLMDIRTIHRGSTEDEMAERTLGADAKILVSIVFGDRHSKLAQAIQAGNTERMVDWDKRNSRPAIRPGGFDDEAI